MKHFRKILCGLLAVCLAAGLLTGCGGKKSSAKDVQLLAYKCADTSSGLEDYANSFNSFVLINDQIFLVGYKYTDTASETMLLRVGTDGSNPTKLPLPTHGENSDTQQCYPQTIFAGPDGSLCLLQCFAVFGTEEKNYEDASTTYYLDKVDTDGNLISSTELNFGDSANGFYPNVAAYDKNGVLYFANNAQIIEFSADGQQRTVDVVPDGNGYINSLLCLADGTIQVFYSDYSNDYAFKSNTLKADGTLGEAKTLPENLMNATVISDPNGKVYFYDDSGIYSFDAAAGTQTKICDWLDSDINYDSMSNLTACADGSFLAVNRGDNYDKCTISRLTYIDPATMPKKAVLTLGCLYDYNLRSQVLAFNRASDTVRIKIVDYSSYNNESNSYSGATSQLNTDIVSGKVPDIIALSSDLPVDSYAAKGLFLDLYTYLKNDADVNVADLLPNVLKACETDGKLYEIVPSFSIYTVVGAKDVVGDQPGWTMDDFNALLATRPDVQSAFSYAVRKDMLTYGFMFTMNQFIDPATGKCHFDGEDFIKLLEYAGTYPAEMDPNQEYVSNKDLLTQGKALLEMGYFYDFNSIKQYTYDFNGPVTFKGFPTSNGSGSTIVPNLELAISASCSDKDAAWTFLKYFLTDDYQEQQSMGNYPLSSKALDKLATKAMTSDEEPQNGVAAATSVTMDGAGNVIGGSDDDYWSRVLTQAEVDQVMALVKSVDTTMYYNTDLFNIIFEEADSFFSGTKSAQEVDGIIQNRAQTYLSENR